MVHHTCQILKDQTPPFADVGLRLISVAPNSSTTLVHGSLSSRPAPGPRSDLNNHLSKQPTSLGRGEQCSAACGRSGLTWLTISLGISMATPADAALLIAHKEPPHSQAAVAIKFCLGHLQGGERITQKKVIRGIRSTLNSVIATTIPLD